MFARHLKSSVVLIAYLSILNELVDLELCYTLFNDAVRMIETLIIGCFLGYNEVLLAVLSCSGLRENVSVECIKGVINKD